MKITNTSIAPRLLLVLLAVATVSFFGVTGAAQTRKEEVIDIFFADQQHGWLLTHTGEHNRGFRTINGGATWSEIESRDTIYKLFFLDSRTGWALGADTEHHATPLYSLFHTVDGGVHWTQRRLPIAEKLQPTLITDFLFVNPQYGWLVGQGRSGGVAFSTVDGGKTWKEISAVSGREQLEGIAALGQDRIWIFGKNTIAATADAGKTWLKQLDVGHKITDEVLLKSGVILPDGNGWAAGESHGPVVLHTSDFGKSWHENFQPAKEGWFHDIHFGDQETGCAVAESNILYCTTDHGMSWSKRYLPTTHETDSLAYHGPMRVLFSSKESAWLISEEGTLFRSNDGGRSWSAATLPREVNDRHDGSL